MAIIPLYYVIAGSYDVDPDTNDIKEGMCVALNGAAGVRRVDGTTGVGKTLGLCGDTKSSSASSMPGVGTGWTNRVSDYFDDTKASGKVTVYHGGGEFATDQFVDTSMDAADVGSYLKANTNGLLVTDGAAKTADSVAMLIQPAGPYPAGVPGTDINQDAALSGDNTNQYIVIKLLV